MLKGLLIGGGVLVAGTLLYFALKKKVVSKLDTIGGNEKTKTQNLIYNVLADAGFKSQLKGMNAEQAKQFVFNAVVRGNGITQGGVYSEYNYPNIETAIVKPTQSAAPKKGESFSDKVSGLSKLGNEASSIASDVGKIGGALGGLFGGSSSANGIENEYGVRVNCN